MYRKNRGAQSVAGRVVVAVALWGCCATVVPAETIDGRFERAFAVGSDTLVLDIRTGSGRIAVTAGEPGRVRVTGRIRGYADRWTPDGADVVADRVRTLEADPPIEQIGDVLRVGHVARSLRRQVGISFELSVPPNTRVRAHTGSGALLVEGVTAAVETGSGGTRVSQVAGGVTVRASSGSIELSAVSGDADVRTGSGSISVERIDATLRARTGSGFVSVEGMPAGEWNLVTGSGDIRIDVPDAAGFEIEARTGSGTVRTDHPVTVHGEMRRGSLRGTVRGGGPRVLLHTGSGGITVD